METNTSNNNHSNIKKTFWKDKKNIAINIREIYFVDCIQNFFVFLIDKYNVQSYNKKHQQ